MPTPVTRCLWPRPAPRPALPCHPLRGSPKKDLAKQIHRVGLQQGRTWADEVACTVWDVEPKSEPMFNFISSGVGAIGEEGGGRARGWQRPRSSVCKEHRAPPAPPRHACCWASLSDPPRPPAPTTHQTSRPAGSGRTRVGCSAMAFVVAQCICAQGQGSDHRASLRGGGPLARA